MPKVLPAIEAPMGEPAVSTDEPPPSLPEAAQAAEPSEVLLSAPPDDANKKTAVAPEVPMQDERPRLTGYLVESETAPPAGERDWAETSTEWNLSGVNESPGRMRLWLDNTGQRQIHAQLVKVGPKHVVLLKDTGKYTTVPLDRLSPDDLAFVQSQSSGAIGGKF